MAERLINGLSGENTRWGAEIKRLESLEGRLVGDVLLAAAFVSYAGPFNMLFRKSLVEEKWLPDIIERQIPLTSGIRPLDLLTDDATKVRAPRCGRCHAWSAVLVGSAARYSCGGWLARSPAHAPRVPARRPSGPTRACPPTR
jgi:hypothetical protein